MRAADAVFDSHENWPGRALAVNYAFVISVSTRPDQNGLMITSMTIIAADIPGTSLTSRKALSVIVRSPPASFFP
jgi:hypothetical protein